MTTPMTTRPRREYVLGDMQNGAGALGAAWQRTLQQYHEQDDIARDMGTDIYLQMLNDPQVNASLRILIMAVLANEISLAPATPKIPAGQARKRFQGKPAPTKKAESIADQCERAIRAMERPLEEVLEEQMLGAMAIGYSVAEKVLTYDSESKLVYKSIKAKPHAATAFEIDAYGNVIGLRAAQVGVPLLWSPGISIGNKEGLLDRRHFSILNVNTRYGDPRGFSMLRPAYPAWWSKQQTIGEWLKYLANFAVPMLIAILGENAGASTAIPYIDPDTGEALEGDVYTATMAAMRSMHNASAGVFPEGTVIQPVQAQGQGSDLFINTIAAFNDEIAMAITCQKLATQEAKHQARASSEVHQDVLGMVIRYLRMRVVRMVQNDIIRPLVELNYGPVAARDYCPKVSLGESEERDFASDMAALKDGGYQFHWSQFEGLDKWLDMPERMEGWESTPLPSSKDLMMAQAAQDAQALDLKDPKARQDKAVQSVQQQAKIDGPMLLQRARQSAQRQQVAA